MYTIYLYHKYEELFSYTSEVLPQIGDVYTGDEFEDGFQRKVIERIMHPKSDNKGLITITLDYTYPSLVPQKETTEAEANY